MLGSTPRLARTPRHRRRPDRGRRRGLVRDRHFRRPQRPSEQNGFFDGISGGGNDGCNHLVCCLLGAKTKAQFQTDLHDIVTNPDVERNKYDVTKCFAPLGQATVPAQCGNVCGPIAPTKTIDCEGPRARIRPTSIGAGTGRSRAASGSPRVRKNVPIEVHVAGASHRRRGRSSQRHLLAGRHPVRDGDRRAAVPRKLRRARRPAADGRTAAAMRAGSPPHHSAAARATDPRHAREESESAPAIDAGGRGPAARDSSRAHAVRRRSGFGTAAARDGSDPDISEPESGHDPEAEHEHERGPGDRTASEPRGKRLGIACAAVAALVSAGWYAFPDARTADTAAIVLPTLPVVIAKPPLAAADHEAPQRSKKSRSNSGRPRRVRPYARLDPTRCSA